MYKGAKLIGTLRDFCCGIDFRPTGRPNALFSILILKEETERLIDCLEALSSIEIPNKNFHYNFNHKIAKNIKQLLEYETILNAM